MTRKQREKQRHRAENLKATSRERRCLRRKERRAIRRAEKKLLHAAHIGETEAVRRVLAGEIDVSDRRVPQHCKDFISMLRRVKRTKRDKMRRLLEVALTRSPKIATRDFWGSYYLLSMLSWRAEPEGWQPRGKSDHTIFSSLVDHLIVEYPVPRFLYGIFHHGRVRSAGERLAGFFAYVARGGSAYKYMSSGFMPVVMTRRMCHTFLNMPDRTSFYYAIRASQVEALGGTRALAQAICETSLGRGFKKDERFWFTVIRWFCEHPMKDSAKVAPLVDYIGEMRRRSHRYSIKGRTVKSLTLGMEAWHRELARARGLKTRVFVPSGLRAGSWTFNTKGEDGAPKHTVWTMTEILSAAALAAEGRTMRHCVLMYASSVLSKRTSIWSLRCDGIRSLTVRVSRKERAVVEARGKQNRRATPAEMNKVIRWAHMNSLSVNIR
jgi:hypothetical protein